MKRKILSIGLILISLVLLLTSCGGGTVAAEGTATVVIRSGREGNYVDKVYEIDLSQLEDRNEGVVSLLDDLKARGLISYSVTDGGYGAYIDKIGSLTPIASKSEYIGVYTSEPCDYSTGIATETFYANKLLTYAGVGISSMTVNDGTVILFRIDSYAE